MELSSMQANEKNEKIKVSSAEIVVHGTRKKPYYEIKYHDLSDGQIHIGYNSYNLDFVFEWLEECFEIINQAADTIETLTAKLQAANMENGGGWILCSERIPKSDENVLICFDFKGRRSVDLGCFWSDGSPHCDSDEYLTPAGRKERKAVAWMELPKPYKGQP